MRGEREKAEQYFRVALRAGEDAQALAGLGALLLERDDIEAALRHLGRAADLAKELERRVIARRGVVPFAERGVRMGANAAQDRDCGDR